ncbi:ABC transporter ATP-binding protein [Dietzia sp. SLG310A2-38A2]|uniref:ABC transporter ATP-binding protein n=1 Tax=Dietzia sp. SLG310A2-38A2 TaxID=1630643 RepID=UPI0015FA9A7F|nr:ABC transporter ATP-binding protein [Dietzia sp. SLG310A2-38A2]MBB1030075.1 ABC transporter ATP-binding protein [Dietzia sp. SLG310A2-38A2]
MSTTDMSATVMSTSPGLALDDVSVRYGDTLAVDGVTIDVSEGEILALVGPSGCGKTSLLRSIAGMVRPSTGRIRIGGTDVTATPPARRNIGLVPQSYAMFPHMSVRGNVEYGLRARGVNRAERTRRTDELLDLVHLSEYAGRRPGALSGGQRQRVALARALAIDPTVLLLDEPLSALDPQLRAGLRRSLSANLAQVGCTTVIVTHDQQEALALAHSIAIVRDGRVVQHGTPDDLWNHPVDEFVADFLGSGRILDAVRTPDAVEVLGGRWRIPGSGIDVARVERDDPGPGGRVLVRRDSLRIADEGTPGSTTARVLHAEFGGTVTRLRIEVHGTQLDMDHVGPADLGPVVTVAARSEGIVLL